MLEPQADGFRNYLNGGKSIVSSEEKLIDKAQLMGLTAPEMTVVNAVMRVLDQHYDNSKHGLFPKKPGLLTNHNLNNFFDRCLRLNLQNKFFYLLKTLFDLKVFLLQLHFPQLQR